MNGSFTKSKQNFDEIYHNQSEFDCFLSEHLTLSKKTAIKNKDGKKNEEYYKWQFLYALVMSGMYSKDYIGTEIYFPKGNKNSAPIKFDAAIFDDVEWFEYYNNFHNKQQQSALDWLRKHLISIVIPRSSAAVGTNRSINF